MHRCSFSAGKRPRWESAESEKLFTPASTPLLSPTDSGASSNSHFSGCSVRPASEEFERPLYQRKRFKAAPLCGYDTSSCSGGSSQTSSLNQVSLGTFTHASADPGRRWDTPLSGRLAFPQAWSGAIASLPSSHSCLGSLQIASRIASSSSHLEGAGMSRADLYRMCGTEPLNIPSGNLNPTERSHTQPLKQMPYGVLHPRPQAGEWAPQGRLGAPLLRTSLARSAPESSHPLYAGHCHAAVPTFPRADVPHTGAWTYSTKQANPSKTAWQPVATPVRPRLPLTSPNFVLAKWGSLLQLAPDTLFLTEHLFTRLRPQRFFGRLDWTSLLLLLGCLWIACKLEECRLTLPAAHAVASLIAPIMGFAVSPSLVNAVELKVLGLLRWQPLAGWDDLTHVKGRLIVSTSGPW